MKSEDWEGRFRCFAYQSIHDGFNLAQSGEAKCNLYSAKEGDRTMTLKKGRKTPKNPEGSRSKHGQDVGSISGLPLLRQRLAKRIS